MSWGDILNQFLKEFGPTIVALIIGHYRIKSVQAQNQLAVRDLHEKMQGNKDAVEKENAGLSSDAVIDKLSKPGP